MAVDEIVKVVEVSTKFLGILIWPGILLFVLIRFGPALCDFFSSLAEFSFKEAGFEASAKRRQAEATAALVAATVARPAEGATPGATAEEAKAVAELVAEAVTPHIIRRAGKSVVLWVDDRPSNNMHERQTLEALGVNFVLSTSTEDALKKLKHQRFDAIISDMGRTPHSKESPSLYYLCRFTCS